MVTPLGKLTDLPTFKERIRQQPHNINYGLVGYPVLMSADILLYKASAVPVGVDQAPHLEFARETVRSFNHRYNTSVLVEPQMKATEVPKVIGIDGVEKMSKSLNNHIELAATPEETLTTRHADGHRPAACTARRSRRSEMCATFSRCTRSSLHRSRSQRSMQNVAGLALVACSARGSLLRT